MAAHPKTDPALLELLNDAIAKQQLTGLPVNSATH